MADMEPRESPEGRATVQLVSEQVKGLRELIRAEFRDTQRQLDALSKLPTAVSSLSERVYHQETRMTQFEKRMDDPVPALESRVKKLEDKDENSRTWRSVSLPQIVIGTIGLLIAGLNMAVILHG